MSTDWLRGWIAGYTAGGGKDFDELLDVVNRYLNGQRPK